MKGANWWISLALRRVDQAIADLHVANAYPEIVRTLEGVRAELARAETCSTCGAAIDDTQARVSQLRADGAPPRCKDCITRELTEQLISDAARAVEEIDPDELEHYAAERGRRGTDSGL